MSRLRNLIDQICAFPGDIAFSQSLEIIEEKTMLLTLNILFLLLKLEL